MLDKNREHIDTLYCNKRWVASRQANQAVKVHVYWRWTEFFIKQKYIQDWINANIRFDFQNICVRVCID